MSRLQTSSPDVFLPDQKRWQQVATPRHWSGFLSSLLAASAHCVRTGSAFSSPKHDIRSNDATSRVIAASWLLLSEISSSYSENAFKTTTVVKWWNLYNPQVKLSIVFSFFNSGPIKVLSISLSFITKSIGWLDLNLQWVFNFHPSLANY